MSYELEGKIISIDGTISVGPSNFKKREFVVETSGQYPQKIKMELVQEKCNLLDTKKVGDHVKVFFALRGSEWQGKYYTNVQAWRVETIGYTGASKNEETSDEEQFADDLPF